MTTRKHNEFLEADLAEEDASQGYDSDSDAEGLVKGSRSAKRQKVDIQDSDDEDDLDSDGSDEEANEEDDQKTPLSKETKKEKATTKDSSKLAELPGVSKPLTKKNLVKTAEAVKRSGVVYISRIPPFMKPQKLRTLLEPYGTINRIFLSPEDARYRKSRIKQGGNKKRTFGDGWVEFVNKADAKRVCELLNTRIIGGKKSSFYHDDVWNLLYLKNFKWNSLTEQIAAENAERSSRERAELAKTRRENKEFVQNVERAKMLEGMEAKKALKRPKETDDGDHDGEKKQEKQAEEEKRGGERARKFKQTAAVSKTKTGDQSEQVKRVLSKIF